MVGWAKDATEEEGEGEKGKAKATNRLWNYK
jgi:hypothetical protein